MSSKLRYYKSDNVNFIPVAIMQDENNYVNLNKQGFTETYLTIKDAIKAFSCIKSYNAKILIKRVLLFFMR